MVGGTPPPFLDQHVSQGREDQRAEAGGTADHAEDRRFPALEPAADERSLSRRADTGRGQPDAEAECQLQLPERRRGRRRKEGRDQDEGAERVGKARAEAVDECAGEGAGQPDRDHRERIDAGGFGMPDAEALFDRKQEDAEGLGSTAGNQDETAARRDDGRRQRRSSPRLALSQGRRHSKQPWLPRRPMRSPSRFP